VEKENSMTIHMVNLTNPMMTRGPFRELIPVNAQVKIKIPPERTIDGEHLLVSGKNPATEIKEGKIFLTIPEIFDHEIVGIDMI